MLFVAGEPAGIILDIYFVVWMTQREELGRNPDAFDSLKTASSATDTSEINFPVTRRP